MKECCAIFISSLIFSPLSYSDVKKSIALNHSERDLPELIETANKYFKIITYSIVRVPLHSSSKQTRAVTWN